MIKFSRAIALHRYYKITRFYPFLKNIVTKAALAILLFVGVLLALEYFFLDIGSMLDSLVDT